MEPLRGCVSPAALPPRTDGYRGDSQGQWNIRIGRRTIQSASDAQECIYCQKAVKNRSALAHLASGT